MRLRTAPTICTVLCVLHMAAAWRLLGGYQGLASPDPILIHDHTFHFYYASTSSRYLSDSWTTAGYDPYFMAGYAKSFLLPCSSTPAEVVVACLWFLAPALVYKLYVLASVALMPVLVWLAMRIWPTGSDRTCQSPIADWAALVLFLLYHWTDWGSYFVYVGMVPFALSGPMTLLGLAVAARFAECGGRRNFVAAAILASVATTVHLCGLIVLAPGIAAAAIACWLQTRRVRSLALCGLLVAAVIANLFWLAPGLQLAATVQSATTGTVFVNPNVLERFVEFVSSRPIVEPLTLLLAPLGLVYCRRGSPNGFWLLLGSLGFAFGLAYPGGWLRSLDVLQPGRYTHYVFVCGVAPAGWGAAWLAQQCGSRVQPPRTIAALVLIVGTLAAGFAGRSTWPGLVSGEERLTVEMHPTHRRLLDLIRRHVKPGERIFFEERNRGVFQDGRQLADPIGDFRLTPLIPLETGAEVIGGPYLYNYVSTNFTQFGDGRLMNLEHWSAEQLFEFAQVYDVRWIVCWSPKARAACAQNPDRVQIVDGVANPGGQFVVGRFLRKAEDEMPLFWETTRVERRHGRLFVEVVKNNVGRVVLPYHWTPCLRSTPPVKVERVFVHDDPVPFIGLVDPPPKLELFLDASLWRLWNR